MKNIYLGIAMLIFSAYPGMGRLVLNTFGINLFGATSHISIVTLSFVSALLLTIALSHYSKLKTILVNDVPLSKLLIFATIYIIGFKLYFSTHTSGIYSPAVLKLALMFAKISLIFCLMRTYIEATSDSQSIQQKKIPTSEQQ